MFCGVVGGGHLVVSNESVRVRRIHFPKPQQVLQLNFEPHHVYRLLKILRGGLQFSSKLVVAPLAYVPLLCAGLRPSQDGALGICRGGTQAASVDQLVSLRVEGPRAVALRFLARTDTCLRFVICIHRAGVFIGRCYNKYNLISSMFISQ